MNFKFGVLYAKDGQLTDDEMFSNGEFFTFFLNSSELKNAVPTYGSQKRGGGYMNIPFDRF